MIIGIDLGTTNSLAAVYENGRAVLIPNRLGKNLTPSVISVDDNGEILVGETAQEYGYLHPDRTAKVFKRAMGTDRLFKLGDHTFSAEELSSFVLRSLKEDAEVYLNDTVDEAVISVPAYFNDNQRKSTKKAGELAGLTVSRIISEPTASAVAYGVGDMNKMERCMVFDLGGGTFDVSILEYYKNIMEVHAIAGDNFLGGEDFTLVMMELFLRGINLEIENLEIHERNALYKAAEAAKCVISTEDAVMAVRIKGSVEKLTVTQKAYRTACEPLLQRLRAPMERSLRDAGIGLDDLDRVILVGGATKLTMVRRFVREVTGIYPNFYVDPDTSVALGAALQAAMKKRRKSIEEIILTDVCPYTLGTEVIADNGTFDEPGHYLPIIERNTVIPVSKTERVYTAHENQQYVTVKILQGESRLAKNNYRLGELTLEVPVGPKGQEAVDITYTYDINALLEVEVTVISTEETKRIVIQNESTKMSDEEAEKRLKRLQYLKQNPREDEENRLVMLRGERLYDEMTGDEKDLVDKALNSFDYILSSGTRLEIERARKRTNALFDDLEEAERPTNLS